MDQKIKINGLHFHHGSEQNTNLDYKKMYLKALDLVKMFDLKEVKYINLGGGLHELTDTEIKELCSYLSKQEKKHQVIFEPGQYIFKNSGYLTTKILERREFGEDILLVTNASKLNHLNWSTPKLLHSGEEASTRKVKIYGPTCYEEDYLGCYEVSEEFAAHSMNEGDILLFSNISSYSANLNRSFNGIDKAEVHIVGSH